MDKHEYRNIKEVILLDQEKKIESLRRDYKGLKKELKTQKKEFRKNKKELKTERKEKLRYLKKEYGSLDFEKEVKVRGKDLSEEEIRYLRNQEGLPFYYHSEEVFNSVTHIVGGGLGLIGLIIGVVFSCIYRKGDMVSLFSMIVFGITMICLYTISAIYHGLPINRGKRVFQVLDHCTIYIMIAGTYTPVVLLGLQSLAPWHYVFLGAIYFLSILGVVLNATMMRKLAVKIISMILYIAVGWSIIFFYPFLKDSLSIVGVWLLIVGGITYTLGSILYGIGAKKRYFHSVFHLFVIGGTVFQYLSVLLYGVIG